MFLFLGLALLSPRAHSLLLQVQAPPLRVQHSEPLLGVSTQPITAFLSVLDRCYVGKLGQVPCSSAPADYCGLAHWIDQPLLPHWTHTLYQSACGRFPGSLIHCFCPSAWSERPRASNGRIQRRTMFNHHIVGSSLHESPGLTLTRHRYCLRASGKAVDTLGIVLVLCTGLQCCSPDSPSNTSHLCDSTVLAPGRGSYG